MSHAPFEPKQSLRQSPRQRQRAGKPALLAIAHGSRDPRHAAALRGLLDAVQRECPGLLAELAFLDLCGPNVPDALAGLAASEAEDIVVLPLFLSHGYHVGHDIPAVTERAQRALEHTSAHAHAHTHPYTRTPSLTIAAPLGPDPLLMDAVERRLSEQGVRTSDPGLHLAVASATSPPAADLIKALREQVPEQGAARVAVAAYFLAPGLLYDRARADALAAGVPIAAPLTTPDDEPPAELVRLVLERYAQAMVHEPELAAA